MAFENRLARQAIFERRGVRGAERRQAETMIQEGTFTEADIPFLWEQWTTASGDQAYAQKLQEVLCTRDGIYYLIPEIDVNDDRLVTLDRHIEIRPLWLVDKIYYQLSHPMCYQQERNLARALWLLGEYHNTAQDLYFRIFNVNHYDLKQVAHWYEKFFTVLRHVSHDMTLTALQQEEIISTFLGRIFTQMFSNTGICEYSTETLTWWVDRMGEYPLMLKDMGITDEWLSIFAVPATLQEELAYLSVCHVPANDAIRLCAEKVYAFWQEHMAVVTLSENDLYY